MRDNLSQLVDHFQGATPPELDNSSLNNLTENQREQVVRLQTLLENYIPYNYSQGARKAVLTDALNSLRRGEIAYQTLENTVRKEFVTSIASEISGGKRIRTFERLPLFGDYIETISKYLFKSTYGVIYDIIAPPPSGDVHQ